jgi:hypothetical protein
MSSGIHASVNRKLRVELDDYARTLQVGKRVFTPSLVKHFEQKDTRRRLSSIRMGKICMESRYLKMVKYGVWERA